MEEFPAQHDQESRTVSLFFYDPDLLSSEKRYTCFIKLLLPRVQESLAAKLECCEMHEKIRVSGNVFDRPDARRDPEELHGGSGNLAASLAILRKEGIENSGSEESLQSIPLPCFSARARRKKSKRQKLSDVYD